MTYCGVSRQELKGNFPCVLHEMSKSWQAHFLMQNHVADTVRLLTLNILQLWHKAERMPIRYPEKLFGPRYQLEHLRHW